MGNRQGSTDPGQTSWQKYQQGIIYYHPNFGAVWMFPAAVADLWEANKAVLGAPERSSRAFPANGDNISCARRKGLSGTMTYFAGGGIAYTVRPVSCTRRHAQDCSAPPCPPSHCQPWVALSCPSVLTPILAPACLPARSPVCMPACLSV